MEATAAEHEEFIECLLDMSRYGEFDELKEALQYAVPLEVKSQKNGNTLLHMAAANGHYDIVEYLINDRVPQEMVGIYINQKNTEGNTALHWAALNGHLKVVQFLYSHGADGKIQNEAGHTPFYYAEVFQHQEVASFILSNTLYDDEEEDDEEEEQGQEVVAEDDQPER